MRVARLHPLHPRAEANDSLRQSAEQELVEVGAVEVEDRGAEVLLGGGAVRGSEKRRAVLPPHQLERIGPHAGSTRVRQAEGVEKTCRVRAEVDRRPGTRRPRRLLVDLDLDPLSNERERGGQSADAASHDRDAKRHRVSDTNDSIASASRGASSSIAKCVVASSFSTVNQSCSTAKRRCSSRYSGSCGCPYACRTGTGGSSRCERVERAPFGLVRRSDLATGATPHLLAVTIHDAENLPDVGRVDARRPDAEERVARLLPVRGIELSDDVHVALRRNGEHPVRVHERSARVRRAADGARGRPSPSVRRRRERTSRLRSPRPRRARPRRARRHRSRRAPDPIVHVPASRRLRTRLRPLARSATFSQRSRLEHQPVRKRRAGSPLPRSS